MIDRIAAVCGRPVSRETFGRLTRYVELLKDENSRQNLVSSSTLEAVWERHILDSAQLVRFEQWPGASWVDLGSGAGLPGIVVACLVDGPVTLVEPRRLRVDFLHRVVESLQIRANVLPVRAERVRGGFDMITARAVAPMKKLFEISIHLSTGKSRWVLPKGRSAALELADAQDTWQGMFHVEPSVTSGDSALIVADGVRARPA